MTAVIAALDRAANCSTLVPLLDEAFARLTTEEWIEILEQAIVPCGRVNDVPAALADKQLEARGGTVESTTRFWARSGTFPRRCGSATPHPP